MFSAKYIANQSFLLILSTDDLAQHGFKMCILIFPENIHTPPWKGLEFFGVGRVL